MKRSVFSLLFLCFTVIVNAQKLPNIQAENQWLPATSKIDGQLSEWGNTLKAFNKATGVEYTIANDDKNLYLAVRSKDINISSKIMVGGITFMINTDGAAITYPVVKPAYFMLQGSAVKTYQNIAGAMLNDSLAVQKEIVNAKDIKVARLKGISDSLLSIYNPYNIKNRLSYVNNVLVYELTIPMDIIGVNLRSGVFSYSVRLNGAQVPAPDRSLVAPPMIQSNDPEWNRRRVIYAEMEVPTDFSAKYVLSKK